MAVEIRFTDNNSTVLSKVSGNVRAALTAMGTKGVGLTVDQMQSGYGRPIRQTGTLMGDVSYEVERSGKNTVDIGNSLEYGPCVHEGTYKMAGRPICETRCNRPPCHSLRTCAAARMRASTGSAAGEAK